MLPNGAFSVPQLQDASNFAAAISQNQNNGTNMIAASLTGMQQVARDEEKAALLQLLGRQQANQMNFNALSNSMAAGNMPQNLTRSGNEFNYGFASANSSVAAFQMNNVMGMNPMMNPMMMNPMMMNTMGMGMGLNNSMNFDGMTPQQAMLASAGGLDMSMVTTQEDPGWEEQFLALKAYARDTGHCKVPARFKPNPKLGRWVMTQRRQFTLLMQGYPSALTAERIQRLEDIGFTWSIRPEPVKTWNKKFQVLKAYKKTFGNCMVPQRYQGKQGKVALHY